jgi:hypothetical protein
MAITAFKCTATNCTTRVSEETLTQGGIHFLSDAWVKAVRAGSTTLCQAHYHGSTGVAAYKAYFGAPNRRSLDTS